MKKLVMTLALSLVCASLAAAERNDGGTIDLATLRASRVAIEAQYDALTALHDDVQRDLYHSLPIELQQEIWSVQVERFLAANVDLSTEQRSIVYEGLDLLRSGILRRLRSTDSAVNGRARVDVDQFMARAKAALPDQWITEAFSCIGSDCKRECRNNGVAESATRFGLKTQDELPYCSCNLDWGCSTGACIWFPQSCKRTFDGCGWAWADSCNGMCY